MLTDTSDKLGYQEFIDFVNAELVSPTPGSHNSFIDDLKNTIEAEDFYVYAQELYDNIERHIYKGVVVISKTYKLLFLVNGQIVGVNNNSSNVRKLVIFNEDYTDLDTVFSDTINIYDDNTGLVVGQIQIYSDTELGSNYLFVFYRNGQNILYRGVFTSELFVDEIGGSYLIKVDKDIIPLVSFRSAKNILTRFSVEVAENVFVSFEYTQMNQLMTVQDTEKSRSNLRDLAKQGIVFFNE